MKRMVFLATVAAALLAFSACDKKTSDGLKQKVETKAKEAKEAADKQFEKAKPKLKEFGQKANDAMEKTKEAAGSAVENLKNATSTSPAGASPTPAP